LRVGVTHYEVYAVNSFVEHVVNGVGAATTHTNNFDNGVFFVFWKVEIEQI
jgi:hypothetical protein